MAKRKKFKLMKCCCCGGLAWGRQWWNRDAGYTICAKCVQGERQRGVGDDNIVSAYGKAGYHYHATEVPDWESIPPLVSTLD